MRVYCRGAAVGRGPPNGEVERVNVSEPATSLQAAQAKVGALLNPRNVVIVGASDNPPAVDNNTWTVKVLDASGQPVKDAVLSFPKEMHPSDPWMPDHSHGALQAKAVNNGDGTYTVSPLYFFMGGIWSTYISATSGSVTDTTTFTFCIGS